MFYEKNRKKIRLLDELKESEKEALMGNNNGTRKAPPSGSGSVSGSGSGSGNGTGGNVSGSGTYPVRTSLTLGREGTFHEDYNWQITCNINWEAAGNIIEADYGITKQEILQDVHFKSCSGTIEAISHYRKYKEDGTYVDKTDTQTLPCKIAPPEIAGNVISYKSDVFHLQRFYTVYDKKGKPIGTKSVTVDRYVTISLTISYNEAEPDSTRKFYVYDGYINI